MGTEGLVKKIDLVVITGTVPFITAGIFQEDQNDATLISGALSGMSNMFQELLNQGELRHSELHNAHVYIRHLNQMNDSLGIISPEIKYNAQMRVAIIVREGELPKEQELALSELCYSIMVKICEKPKFAKKMVKGNAEGYIPTYHETLEILAEAINDYRKRARKSTFYEKPNFLQEKDRFTAISVSDSILEGQIKNYSNWLEEKFYPDFFPKLDFEKFFGKADYWTSVLDLKKKFAQEFSKKSFKDRVSASLIQFILQAGLVPLVQYSGDIVERISSFYEDELTNVFEKFTKNLLQIRGPTGMCLRTINSIMPKLALDDKSKVGWQFLRYFIEEIGDRPFEQPFLKQMCKILEQFELKEKFLSNILQSHNEIVPREYLATFAQIINSNLSKPVDLETLKQNYKPVDPEAPLKKPAPEIPKSVKVKTSKQKQGKDKTQKFVKQDIKLPKATPESNIIKNQALLFASSNTFSWVHRFLFGEYSINKKTPLKTSNDGLLFYNISESLTVEIGLIYDLIQAFSGPRTWLIGQLNRIIENVEGKLRNFTQGTNSTYEAEKKIAIDVQHVTKQFRSIAERIMTIISQIESDAKKGRITRDNMKSYLETGFLGRVQEISIPNTRKLLDELKSLNKNLSSKELNLISKAMGVNIKGLISNVTSLQFQATPLPEKESEYPKTIRDTIAQFKKWNLNIEDSITTLFRIGLELDSKKTSILNENLIHHYLRTTLTDSVNTKLSQIANSDNERKEFANHCFQIKNDLFMLIGDRLLQNRPLKLFTKIPLVKEENYFVFNFTLIKPHQLSEDIIKFYIISNDEQNPEINGRVYTYHPFNNEQINNLTELIISDAFRRALECVEPSLNKIVKISKKYHSGITKLFDLLMDSYELICRELAITKTTN
jgi:hypothetical protein